MNKTVGVFILSTVFYKWTRCMVSEGECKIWHPWRSENLHVTYPIAYKIFLSRFSHNHLITQFLNHPFTQQLNIQLTHFLDNPLRTVTNWQFQPILPSSSRRLIETLFFFKSSRTSNRIINQTLHKPKHQPKIHPNTSSRKHPVTWPPHQSITEPLSHAVTKHEIMW